MSSQNITYTIANVFDQSSDGALGEYEAKYYYIASYQRGYKWSSNDQNSPVCVLMRDLFHAYDKKLSEYYLQYITTKKRVRAGDAVLEVIDGQQRLTTLTILLSVLAEKNKSTPVSTGLLSYAVRKNVTVFFNKYIYSNINKIIGKEWKEFIKESPENNEQDIFYLFSASNKINQMIEEHYQNKYKETKKFEEYILAFENYILNHVKILLNDIDKNINCEEVFSNLNSNKIDLTETDLIKGLWLTSSARERKNNERRISYREIIEIRSVIGRQWDEIANWINRDEVKSFLFPKKQAAEPVNNILLMLALDNGYMGGKEKNALFYHFDAKIRGGDKPASEYLTEYPMDAQILCRQRDKPASEYLTEYRELCSILTEWFSDKEIYNYLGYILFSKNSKFTLHNKEIMELLKRNKTGVKQALKRIIAEEILRSDIDIENLEYDNNNDKDTIHNLLLAVNVFSYKGRFDFPAFNKADWSLEHIFPQNPKDFKENLGVNDIELINNLIDNNKWENIPEDIFGEYAEKINIKTVCSELQQKLNEKNPCIITEYECTVLNHIIETGKLHSIGNMALLTKEDNSSNGNGMFDAKRINIAKKVKNGSFVPPHTYDVFSKLLSEKMSTGLEVWNENDIDEHLRCLQEKIKLIKGIHDE